MNPIMNPIFSIAPMMGWTNRHGRFLLRLLTKHSLIYTEMIAARAVIEHPQRIAIAAGEHPIVLQLAGCDERELARAAAIGEQAGYDAININAGCPSRRAREGGFGAALMTDPARVARLIAATKQAVSVPVSIKCRLGVDEQNPAGLMPDFVRRCVDAGCASIIIHARKAWLKGIDPKANRTIPPLDYDLPRQLAASAGAAVILNGGLNSLEEARKHSKGVSGVMIGRAAFRRPMMLARADEIFFRAPPSPPPARQTLIARLAGYISEHRRETSSLAPILRSWMELFHGLAGARQWRRFLGETLPRHHNPAAALMRFAEQDIA